MSPEQARGHNVDKRADIWAFGAVLYELITGKQLFQGSNVSDTLAAVLRQEPDMQAVPARFRRLVRSCLVRDPRQRMRDIGDARLFLEDIQETAPKTQASKTRLAWLAGAFFAMFAAGAMYAWLRRPEVESPVTRFYVAPPEKTTILPNSGIALSPDGRHLAFTAQLEGQQSMLWVRDMDTLDLRMFPNTEGARLPFWSPDSRFIGFNTVPKLKKVGIAGGPPLTLCDSINLRGASWSGNDVIVFAPDSATGLFRVSSAGGIPASLTELDSSDGENSHRWPWFLPDGRHFLYTARSADPNKTSVYMGDLESKARKLVLRGGTNAVFAPPGFLLFSRERALLVQAFDPARDELKGEPAPLSEKVDYIALNQQAVFTASLTGTLAFLSGGSSGRMQNAWFDRSGKLLTRDSTVADAILNVAISPDGGIVAEARQDGAGGIDIWQHDLGRDTLSRFTFGSTNLNPVWSPNGACIAYNSRSSNGYAIHVKPASGAGEDKIVHESPQLLDVSDWSRDSRFVFYREFESKNRFDIWMQPLAPAPGGGACPRASGDPIRYQETEFTENSPKLSPDGHWLAYVSDESKRDEVYVQSFPQPGAKFQVSNAGGNAPRWSRDGKELLYLDLGRALVSVAVDVKDQRLAAGTPKALFITPLGSTNRPYDIRPDGKQVLVPQYQEPGAASPMTVVLNWQAALRK